MTPQHPIAIDVILPFLVLGILEFKSVTRSEHENSGGKLENVNDTYKHANILVKTKAARVCENAANDIG